MLLRAAWETVRVEVHKLGEKVWGGLVARPAHVLHLAVDVRDGVPEVDKMPPDMLEGAFVRSLRCRQLHRHHQALL